VQIFFNEIILFTLTYQPVLENSKHKKTGDFNIARFLNIEILPSGAREITIHTVF
jgi:hypothetical protein